MPLSLPQVSLPQGWEQRSTLGTQTLSPRHLRSLHQGRTDGRCRMGYRPHLSTVNSPPQLVGQRSRDCCRAPRPRGNAAISAASSCLNHAPFPQGQSSVLRAALQQPGGSLGTLVPPPQALPRGRDSMHAGVPAAPQPHHAGMPISWVGASSSPEKKPHSPGAIAKRRERSQGLYLYPLTWAGASHHSPMDPGLRQHRG